jgi:uncharacterized protein YqgV (UPF0045/DUF77 family)
MKLRDFAVLPPAKKREVVASLVSASMEPSNGKGIKARLSAFETRYEMTTAQMLAAFKAGKLDDTADIAAWLVFARVRG